MPAMRATVCMGMESTTVQRTECGVETLVIYPHVKVQRCIIIVHVRVLIMSAVCAVSLSPSHMYLNTTMYMYTHTVVHSFSERVWISR